jgi:deoxyribonuclease-4
MRFGFHISIAGGFHKAVERAITKHCQTIQFFSRNPRGWQFSALANDDISQFQSILKKVDVSPVFVHMPYLPNLASPDKILYQKSLISLAVELKRCEVIGAHFLIMHIGKRMNSSEESSIKRVSDGINKVFKQVKNSIILLLENTAGMGSEIGHNFNEIADIINRVDDNDRLGITLDTAHAFEAGYPLHTKEGLNKTLREFDQVIGMQKLRLLHLNDSKTESDSKIDRHWHIGQGKIGREGFKNIINHPLLKYLPAIMETPKKSENDDRENMRMVKSLINHN